MLQEIKEIEAQLKQILYGCVEHVQATKAALYLSASHDLNEKAYEIATSYQYNPGDRKVVRANDDLVDRLAVKRNAFYVNGLAADHRFAEMMFRQGNDRMLAAPIFSRGRLVGFIDMRDKAGKKPFEMPDTEAARRIADQVGNLLATKGLFGLAPFAVAEDAPPQRITQSQPMPNLAAVSVPGTPAPRSGPAFSQEASRAVEAARQYMTRRQLAQGQQSARRSLTEGDFDVIRILLPSALAMPGATIACFSAAGQMNNPQGMVALANLADDASDLLHRHLQEGLKRANQPHMTSRIQPLFPFGAQAYPIQAEAITTILSAPVNPQSVEGLILTVAFERTTETTAQRLLQHFLTQMEPTIDAAIASTARQVDRVRLAEKLLEPDFQKIPDLAEHCREVSVIAQRFARSLELSATQVETVRIAALVHDVGLRLLDYERLYRRTNLTAEEMRGLAEHPVIGAALVEPILGTDVAQAVLRHHERVDGKGYPSRMSGQQIPLASRIVQIADAWVAMTGANSYQAPDPHEVATAKMLEGSGTQFDAALLERFLNSLPELV